MANVEERRTRVKEKGGAQLPLFGDRAKHLSGPFLRRKLRSDEFACLLPMYGIRIEKANRRAYSSGPVPLRDGQILEEFVRQSVQRVLVPIE